jgi:hypothetical protein
MEVLGETLNMGLIGEIGWRNWLGQYLWDCFGKYGIAWGNPYGIAWGNT